MGQEEENQLGVSLLWSDPEWWPWRISGWASEMGENESELEGLIDTGIKRKRDH